MAEHNIARPSAETTPVREYSIGDLAASYGISLRTLRFYEERGLLRPARRGAQRVFSETDRARLEIVMLGKRLGFSLTEILDLVASCGCEQKTGQGVSPSAASLGLSERQIGARIEHLVREREIVHRAIEELQAAASRIEGRAESQA